MTDDFNPEDITNEELAEIARGDRHNTTDEAAHLNEDVEAEQFGTTDPQEAVERGIPYEPPDHAAQEDSSREER